MIALPQCRHCKHLFSKPVLRDGIGEPGCSAFLEGIPDEILFNRHDHKQPYPDDHGIRFEPVKPAAPSKSKV